MKDELTQMMLNHLNNTSREDLDKEWDELRDSLQIGPKVSEITNLIELNL